MGAEARYSVCRLASLTVLLCCCWICVADVYPEVSLTLIPPSPVTDKINLDIRGAVWNRSEQEREYDVKVYLNEESDKGLLFTKTLKVGGKSCEGIRFILPADGHVGRGKVVLVAECKTQVLRTSRPIEIIASEIRSTKRIEGGWFEFYHWSEAEGLLWNKDIIKLADKEWKELVRGMNGIGMNVVIIQDTYHNPNRYVGKHSMDKDGFDGKAYYPSEIYPQNPMVKADDPLEAVLSEADNLGMHVFIGIGGYAWFDFTEGSLEWHKRVAREIWEMYGHHRSFYGWYVSDEIAGHLGEDNRRKQELVDFFRGFKAHTMQLAPDKPVMLATNCHLVAQSNGYYPKLLRNLDILCPFGFHRMPVGDAYTGAEVAKVLQKYCDEAGSHLWMDMEVFLFGEKRQLYPRPIRQIVEDLELFDNFEKICCYSYTGLMNSPQQSARPGGNATVQLYNDYKRFLVDGAPDYSIKHGAVGAGVKFRNQPDKRYAKGDLTDGEVADSDYWCRQWLGFQDADVDAVLDLGEVKSVDQIQVNFLQFVTAGIVLPAKVEIQLSEDGRDFLTSAVITQEILEKRPGAFIHTFKHDKIDVKARYIRVVAEPVGEWLFIDEVIVNPVEKLNQES